VKIVEPTQTLVEKKKLGEKKKVGRYSKNIQKIFKKYSKNIQKIFNKVLMRRRGRISASSAPAVSKCCTMSLI